MPTLGHSFACTFVFPTISLGAGPGQTFAARVDREFRKKNVHHMIRTYLVSFPDPRPSLPRTCTCTQAHARKAEEVDSREQSDVLYSC